MSSEILDTKDAPAAGGYYSQGVKSKSGNLVFTTGQIPVDPKTGKLVNGDIKEQTRMAIENIKAILKEADATLEDVVKVTVFIVDINQAPLLNEIYTEYFSDIRPARSLVEVTGLALGAELEIEAIAAV